MENTKTLLGLLLLAWIASCAPQASMNTEVFSFDYPGASPDLNTFNGDSVRSLKSSGIGSSSTFELGFILEASSLEDAEALKLELESLGYGPIRIWARGDTARGLSGSTSVTPVSQRTFNDLGKRLVEIVGRHNGKFLGWQGEIHHG